MNGPHPPDWVCLSPKVAPELLRLPWCNELKVVLPRYHPKDYEKVKVRNDRFVQPEDGPHFAEAVAQCHAWVHQKDWWKISVQTHKILDLP